MPRALLSFVGTDTRGLLGNCASFIADPRSTLAGKNPSLESSEADILLGCSRALGRMSYLQLYFSAPEDHLDQIRDRQDEFARCLGRNVRIDPAGPLETEDEHCNALLDRRVAKIMVKANPRDEVLEELKNLLHTESFKIVQHDGLLAQQKERSIDPDDWSHFDHIHLIRLVSPAATSDGQIVKRIQAALEREGVFGAEVRAYTTRLGETLDPGVFNSSAPLSERGYVYIRAYIDDIQSHLPSFLQYMFQRVSFYTRQNDHTPFPVVRSSSRRIADRAVVILCVPGTDEDRQAFEAEARTWNRNNTAAQITVKHERFGPTHYRDDTDRYRRLLVQTSGPNAPGVLATVARVFESVGLANNVHTLEYDGNSDFPRYEGSNGFGSRQVFGVILKKEIDVLLLRERLHAACGPFNISVEVTES